MSTSYQVIDRVRRAISTQHVTASDTDVARALGISRAVVSAYKVGKTVMSHDTLAKAHELAQFERDELADFVLMLSADAAATPAGRALLNAQRYLTEYAKRFPAGPVVMAVLLCLACLSPGTTYAREMNAVLAGGLYIMRTMLRRTWARVMRVASPPHEAPLLCGAC
jgi:hypothetical protein